MNRTAYILAAFIAVTLIIIFAVAAFVDSPGTKSDGSIETEDQSPGESAPGPDKSKGGENSKTASGETSPGSVSEPSGDSSGNSSGNPSGNPSETSVPPDVSDPEPPVETWEYDGLSVRHLFTHCLVAWPELAPEGAYRDCLTVSEWKAILNELYDRDFVLIDVNYMFETYKDTDNTDKIRVKNKITVPKGKKPLVISIDDVVYDPKKTNQGMVDKLVIKDGELWTYTLFKDGREDFSQDNEIFTILESFIKDHPDFSYKNAKCTLNLTGFCGILGYRTSPSYADAGIDYMAEREKAAVVVKWLKAHGYSFASHSYAHGMMGSFSPQRMEEDCRLWRDEVESLVGQTDVFIYPYGDWPKYDTALHQTLLNYGFKFFCGTSTYNYLINGFPGKGASVGNAFCDRFTAAGTVLDRADRKDPDGTYAFYERIKEYFDPFVVYDNENRKRKLVRPADLT